MPLAAIVAHGKPIVITLHEEGDDGGDPADEWNEREDEDRYCVDGLPKGVAEGETDSPTEIGVKLLVGFELELATGDEGFGLLAEIGEKGGAYDKEQVFEQGEIKEYQHQSHHDASHHEQEAQGRALLVMQPSFHADEMAEPGYGCVGGVQEEIDTYAEQDGVEDPGNKDPFPKFVLGDEMMGPGIGLEGYDNFL